MSGTGPPGGRPGSVASRVTAAVGRPTGGAQACRRLDRRDGDPTPRRRRAGLDRRQLRRHSDVMELELSQYVEALRHELAAAAAAGTEETRRVADLLGRALDSSVRLVIMDALSQAADEITAALPDAAVEVRLRGREPQIVVGHTEPDAPRSQPVPGESDADTVRVTLRLPEPLKNAVEDAANRAAVSVNSWLVRAVKRSLDTTNRRRGGRRTISGFAQA